MGVSQNVSGPRRDYPVLAIALKILTRRLLRRGARYGRKLECQRPQTKGRALAIASKLLTHRPPHTEARHSEA